MNGRKLGPDGDIYLDGNKIARTGSKAEAVKQLILTTVKTFAGECFSDESAGIPWFDEVLGQDVLAADAAKQTIREKIASVPGVKSVETVTLTISGRNMSGAYRITLEDDSTTTGAF